MTEETSQCIQNYIERYGEQELLSKLNTTYNQQENILTIISNQGVHPLGELHKRGEIFYASKGDLDFSTELKATEEIKKILEVVANKLKSNSWERVYLVPFGPAALSMQIKSLVYRILHIDTVDVLHIGNGIHVDIEINPRKIALQI